MTWIVGREHTTLYVEEGTPLTSGGIPCGEQSFETEIEALLYAVEVLTEDMATVRANMRNLKSRLRRVERKRT